ncbi:hypothetical protein DRJ00_07940 [Candidatus Aerophobetes bacterium]|uniref:Uncharacterized protein n=1 Tax=Aerophobetes bacterium TaxID=2030807 RepID=A0A497E1U8_UNCAE|nr:MAG: hypothetical protein DRJ00_07940 [Candidatus Aerophobetes bacterium]
MIQAIKELGEYKLKREGRDTSHDILSTLVQDPDQTGRYLFVFVIVFTLKREWQSVLQPCFVRRN